MYKIDTFMQLKFKRSEVHLFNENQHSLICRLWWAKNFKVNRKRLVTSEELTIVSAFLGVSFSIKIDLWEFSNCTLSWTPTSFYSGSTETWQTSDSFFCKPPIIIRKRSHQSYDSVFSVFLSKTSLKHSCVKNGTDLRKAGIS